MMAYAPAPARAAAAAALFACLATGLPGCSLTPYKIDIQQGNVVTQEDVSKLRTGMTRQQVKFVLGTPLVTDPFHPGRWDYFYKFDKAGNPREQRRLTLIFEDERLKAVVGDVTTDPGLVRLDPPAAAPSGSGK